MTGVLFAGAAAPEQIAQWRTAITRRLPGAQLHFWPDCGDLAKIEVVLAWRYPHGLLKQFPNLKLICSLGAGVDHIMADPDLPQGVPITRLKDPDLAAGIAEYVTLAVLRHHRQWTEYETLQRAAQWKQLGLPATRERRIGLMGLGLLGQACAAHLEPFGFPLAGWVRSSRASADVELFVGEAGLAPFLARSDILVCLLPLTPATTGILNARSLAQLPQGAHVINVARGKHIVDADLIAALDSGHLAGATLDVFATEPLPPEHPFWRHSKIAVTPHVAALTNPDTAAEQICEDIRRCLSGRPLLGCVETTLGY